MRALLSSLKTYGVVAIQALNIVWDVWHVQDATGSPEAKQDQKELSQFFGGGRIDCLY